MAKRVLIPSRSGLRSDHWKRRKRRKLPRLNPLKIGSTFGPNTQDFTRLFEFERLNPLKIGSTFGPGNKMYYINTLEGLNPLKIGSTFGPSLGWYG